MQAPQHCLHLPDLWSVACSTACYPSTELWTKADAAELAEHYRSVLADLAGQFTSTRVEVYCHLSSLSTSSPDYDPEQASRVPLKTIVSSETGPVVPSSEAAAADAAAAKQGESSCCCGPEITPAGKGKQVSDDSDSDYSAPSGEQEKGVGAESETETAIALRAGRPDVGAHVRRIAYQYGTAAIAICGPKELVFDARNAVAQEQLKIVRGDIACTDLYLHTEVFEW